eukprot:8678613-Alexandrium_andersonii.AAC.1
MGARPPRPRILESQAHWAPSGLGARGQGGLGEPIPRRSGSHLGSLKPEVDSEGFGSGVPRTALLM